jgi:hypothetical protein
MAEAPHLLLVLDFLIISVLACTNMVTVIWAWAKLSKIKPPEREWRRWQRRLSVTSALAFLHLFLMTWWISVAPLGLPWLVHVLFTVFHAGFCVAMTRYHRDIVTQARLWKVVNVYLGEPELRELLSVHQTKAA